MCDKHFENSYEMKTHMLTHTCYESKFKCEDCKHGGQNGGNRYLSGQRFKSLSDFKKHMK